MADNARLGGGRGLHHFHHRSRRTGMAILVTRIDLIEFILAILRTGLASFNLI